MFGVKHTHGVSQRNHVCVSSALEHAALSSCHPVLCSRPWAWSHHRHQVEPVPSLLRGFSAPVKLVVEGQTDEHLKLMFAHDSDSFNR